MKSLIKSLLLILLSNNLVHASNDYNHEFLFDEISIQEKILEYYPKNYTNSRAGVKRYLPIMTFLAKRLRIDPKVVISMAWIESDFQMEAKSLVNAQGIMQIKPSTQKEVRRLFDNVRPLFTELLLRYRLKAYEIDNILLGVLYFKHLLNRYNNDYKKALVSYNEGPYGMRRWLKRNNHRIKDHRYLKKLRSRLDLLTYN
jgi:soluble lytic murein transglycosylase-like protein